MQTSKKSASVRCPFYRSDDEQSVWCEGITETSTNKMRFKNKADCERYMDGMCVTSFERCGLYKAIMAKYE